MMNILLVDDDLYVLDSLEKSIDWEELGVWNVYKASSVGRAEKIISTVPIQILLCDIEMPKENGFELLKWIQERRMTIAVIMLTNYSEFEYASKAIEYQCVAYALKPIDYEKLKGLIRKAIMVETRDLQQKDYLEMQRYWAKVPSLRKHHFFYEWIHGNENRQEAEELGYRKGSRFLPVILALNPEDGSPLENWQMGMREWSVETIVRDSFSSAEISAEALIHIKNGYRFQVILKLNGVLQGTYRDKEDFSLEPAQQKAKLQELAEGFLKKISYQMKQKPAIQIGMETSLKQLAQDTENLLEYVETAMVPFGEIVFLDSYEIRDTHYIPPDYKAWELFLSNGEAEGLKKSICEYVDNQAVRKNLNQKRLRRVMQGFASMVIVLLKEHGICSYVDEEPVVDLETFLEASSSIENAKAKMCELGGSMAVLLSGKSGTGSISDEIRRLIDENIDQDLNRKFLADKIHLNEDYLSRSFKREVGESIGNYVLHRRMELAAAYLTQTGESVNQIANKLGYDNFSYFTKLFKNQYGKTPKEYRKDASDGI